MSNQHAPQRRRRTSLPRGARSWLTTSVFRLDARPSGCITHLFQKPVCSADGQSDPALGRTSIRNGSLVVIVDWPFTRRHVRMVDVLPLVPQDTAGIREFTAWRSTARASKVKCPELGLRPFDYGHARLLPPCDSQKSTHIWRLHPLATRRWCDRWMQTDTNSVGRSAT